MVKRLSIFRECLAAFERHFVLIGGAACVEWLVEQGGNLISAKNEYMMFIFRGTIGRDSSF